MVELSALWLVRTCPTAVTKSLESEYKMSKMKTKSSTKRRFRLTASGKVRVTQAGKRHFMRRRSQSMIRKSRGTTIMAECDMPRIRKLMPYA
jgi:large subunit ribosomal protein L35